MNNHCTNVPPQRVSNLIRRITIANNGVEATQNAIGKMHWSLVAVRLREIFDLGGGLQHSGSYPMVFQHSVSQSSRVIQVPVDTGLFMFICIEAGSALEACIDLDLELKEEVPKN